MAKLILASLYLLVQIVYSNAQCQETCVLHLPELPVYWTCKDIYGKNLPFQSPMWKLRPGKTCISGGHESKNMAYCCTSEKAFKDFEYNEKARSKPRNLRNLIVFIFCQIFHKSMVNLIISEIVGALAGAREAEYPHQVKFEKENADTSLGNCGATIYNKEWVITAAHCIKVNGKTRATPQNSWIIAGKTDMNEVTEADKYRIKEIISHKDWKEYNISLGYDIALLHLAKPLPLEIGKIQPLRIVKPGYKIPYGGQGITIGWGRAAQYGAVKHLKEFEVPIHHPTKAAQLSFDDENATPVFRGSVPIDQHFGVAGSDSGYSKKLYFNLKAFQKPKTKLVKILNMFCKLLDRVTVAAHSFAPTKTESPSFVV